MNKDLFKAVLAMDSYYRGYEAGINITESTNPLGKKIGNATIISDSSALTDSLGNVNIDQPIGFYALTYDLGGGEYVIGYRGTDYPQNDNSIPKDIANGWLMGGGALTPQGLLAIDYYNAVVDDLYGTSVLANDQSVNISLTGHSLGGGLSGFIGALYDQDAVVFDAMTYELAAQNAYNDALYTYNNSILYTLTIRNLNLLKDTSGLEATQAQLDAYIADPDIQVISQEPYKSNLLERAYGDEQPWQYEYDEGIKGYHVQGEILDLALPARSLPGNSASSEPALYLGEDGASYNLVEGSPFIQYLTAQIFGSAGIIGAYGINSLADAAKEAIALHSQASLVIRMAADEITPSNNDWKGAGEYFWPLLYNSAFAESIGMDASSVSGELQTAGGYDGILRAILAYSAIDEGTRVFGDTGIRALYDDANDLGAAITSVQSDATNPLIQMLGTDISKVFVQFAGQLALNKVEALAVPGALAADGVLTRVDHGDNQNLILNFSEGYWNSVLNTTQHYLDLGRGKFMVSMLNILGIDSSDILDASFKAWGNGSYTVFDRVVLSTTAGGTSVIEESAFPDSTKNSLFIGGNGADHVTGSSGNDLILGSLGYDTIIGGAGSDTLTFTQSAKRIIVTFTDGNSGSIEKISGNSSTYDCFSEIETIIGTEGIDGFSVSGSSSPENLFGLAGDDVFFVNGPITQSLVFDGGSDNDTVYLQDLLKDDFVKTSTTEYLYTSISDPSTTFEFYNVEEVIFGGDSVAFAGTWAGHSSGSFLSVDKELYIAPQTVAGTYNSDMSNQDTYFAESSKVSIGSSGSMTVSLGGRYVSWTSMAADPGEGPPTTPVDLGVAANGVIYDRITIDSSNGGTGFTEFSVIINESVSGYFGFTRHGTPERPPISSYFDLSGSNLQINLNDQWYDYNKNLSHVVTNPWALATYHFKPRGGDYSREIQFRFTGTEVEFDFFLGVIRATGGGAAGGPAVYSGYGRADIEFVLSEGSSLQSDSGVFGTGIGTDLDDFLPEWIGTENNETFSGSGFDETIYGGGGNDIINGGLGFDKAIFSGNYENYTINSVLVGQITRLLIIDNVGTDGTDDVSGDVEQLVFSDGVYENGVFTSTNNTDPIAANDTANVNVNESVTVNVLSNDSDGDGDTLTVSIATSASNGSLTVHGNNTITYTPDADYYGTDNFTYSVDDGNGGTDSATVNVVVSPSVDPDQTIAGTDGKDTLHGGTGNDTLHGNADNDIIYGGAGADIINGGSGWDIAHYGDSDVAVNIDLSLSTQIGGIAQGDTLIGIEVVTGTVYDDVILGNSARNNLRGNNGSDILRGQGGNDILSGQNDDDTLYGGSGNDGLYGNAGADTLDGEAGIDTAVYTGSNAAVDVDLNRGAQIGGHAQGDTLTSIENVTGSSHGDTITGDSGKNLFKGANGNDTLRGGAGNDVLYGGAGADILDGGSGWDIAHYGDSTAAVNIGMSLAAQVGGIAQGDILANIEVVTGSNYNDTLIGNSGYNNLRGGNGEDILRGQGGRDILSGQNGNDTLYGGSGNDDLYGNTGADALDGEAGIDTAVYTGSNAAVDVDLTRATQIGGHAQGDTFTSIENVTGSSHGDMITGDSARNILKGANGDDILNGGAGKDVIYGGTGADIINGGSGWDIAHYGDSTTAVNIDMSLTTQIGGIAQGDSLIGIEVVTGSVYDDVILGNSARNNLRGNNGDDILRGQDGNDVMSGQNGNDTLYGGAGNDDLYGNAGADTFVFSTNGGSDTVKDFKLSENDKLDISDLLSGYDPLNDVISDFVQITDDGTHSFLKVDTDGGADNFVQIATLTGVTGLTIETGLETSGVIITA